MWLPDSYKIIFLSLLYFIFLYLYSRRCVLITNPACAAEFLQSYYIPVAGRKENEIFAIVREISDQLDHFCRIALVSYTCHFLHPPCDPKTGIYRKSYS